MIFTVIGYGFVGKAVYEALSERHSMYAIDPDKGYTDEPQKYKVDGIILCLPAPTVDDKWVRHDTIYQYMEKISNINPDVPVLIKSTITPEFARDFVKGQFTYSPEFLTAMCANEDFKNSEFMVFGGDGGAFWAKVFQKVTSVQNIRYCRPEQAAFMKYTINSFLATKVSWLNELKDVYTSFGCDDFSTLMEMVHLDPRIGNSHDAVPGPDGMRGWGGACFPKDTAAFSHFAKKYNAPLRVLDSAIEVNKKWRKNA